MKKLLAIILTIVMFSSLLTPCVFAVEEQSAQPVIYDYTIKSCTNFKISDAAGNIFGSSSADNVKYVITSTDNKISEPAVLDGNTDSKALADGQKVKVSTTIASEEWHQYYYLFALGFDFPGDVAYGNNLAVQYVNMKNGSLGGAMTTYGDYAVNTSSGTTVRPAPVNSWVTLDYVLSVDSGGTDCKVSFYINGRPYIEKAPLDVSKAKAITAIEAPSVCLRTRDVFGSSFYMSNLSMTIYPANYDGTIVESNPFDTTDADFTANADGSSQLADITVDSAAIAVKAPEGWTYSYINANGTTDIADEGYIIMTSNSGTKYYEKLNSSAATALLTFNSVDTWTELLPETSAKPQLYSFNGNIRLNGTHKGMNTTELKRITDQYPTDIEGKSNNKVVSLTYTQPSGGVVNGFTASTTANVGTGTYTKMMETGRLAYEASVLIPSAGTRDFVFWIMYNSVMLSNNASTDADKETPWVPMTVAPSGKATFAGTVEEGFENFAINYGEWYRFTAILDTDADTGEFYINGKKAASYKFDELTNVSRYLLGYSTIGSEDTSADNFSFAFDDISIKKLRADWTVPTLELTANDGNVTIDNKNGVIIGEFADLQAFSNAVTIPEGATYKFYTEKTITSAAEEGAVGKYLLVKNADETIIREYVIASNDLTVTGLDVSDLNTDVKGTKEITVSIENMTAADINTMVAIASYNSDGALVALGTLTKPAVFKDVTDYTVSLNVTEEPVSEIKAFVWKYDDLSPYMINVSTKNN